MVEGSGTSWVDGRYEHVLIGPGIVAGKKNGCNVYKQVRFTHPPNADEQPSAFIYIEKGGHEWRIMDEPNMLVKAPGKPHATKSHC